LHEELDYELFYTTLAPSIKPKYKIVKKQIEKTFYTFVVRDSENKHYLTV